MIDKEFNEKIVLLESLVTSSKLQEATVLLDSLREAILPEDLPSYISCQSLKEDVNCNRNIEYIKKDIKVVKERLIQQRIPKKDKIVNFSISVISYSLIPLVPFVANVLLKEETTGKDIVLSFAMYCIGITMSFKSILHRTLGIFLSIIVFLLVDKSPQPNAIIATYMIALFIVIMLVNDRLNRHIKGDEPYS
jgi:hypothetical protein